MTMTDGELRIWYAVYAAAYVDQRGMSPTGRPLRPAAASSLAIADEALMELRYLRCRDGMSEEVHEAIWPPPATAEQAITKGCAESDEASLVLGVIGGDIVVTKDRHGRCGPVTEDEAICRLVRHAASKEEPSP